MNNTACHYGATTTTPLVSITLCDAALPSCCALFSLISFACPCAPRAASFDAASVSFSSCAFSRATHRSLVTVTAVVPRRQRCQAARLQTLRQSCYLTTWYLLLERPKAKIVELVQVLAKVVFGLMAVLQGLIQV